MAVDIGVAHRSGHVIGSFGFVLHGFDGEIAHIAIQNVVPTVVVSLQIECNVVLLQQRGERKCLFQRHIAGGKTRIVVFEQVGVCVDDSVPVFPIVFGECLLQPLLLFVAQGAAAGVDANEQIGVVRRLHYKCVSGCAKVRSVVVPLVEVEVVIANGGENGVVACLRGCVVLQRIGESCKMTFAVYQIAEQQGKIGVVVVAHGGQHGGQVVGGGLGVYVGADVECVVVDWYRQADGVVGVVPRLRLFETLADSVAWRCNEAAQIEVATATYCQGDDIDDFLFQGLRVLKM